MIKDILEFCRDEWRVVMFFVCVIAVVVFVIGLIVYFQFFYMEADRASVYSLSSDFEVRVYSGGQRVETLYSDGKVLTGKDGTRFAFKEKGTGLYVRVSEGVIVRELPKGETNE